MLLRRWTEKRYVICKQAASADCGRRRRYAGSIRVFFEAHGFDTRAAVDGADAFAEYCTWHPDVVVLDIQMPGLDGRAVAREIRRLQVQPAPLLVAVTALSSPSEAAASITSGYEPCYETGKAVRWRVGTADGKPFAIAGLWRAWNGPDGCARSFTMLTANADHHPLMRRFHKPGDEKRSVVVLPPSQYEEWLGCREPELARTFFRLPHENEMTAEASPLPPRKPARPSGNESNDLFGHP